MKIAFSSSDNSPAACLDPRFGRCAYFAIYDSDTFQTEFVPNPHRDAPEGAGPASVQFILEWGICKVVSGAFGFKVQKILEELEIQPIALGNEKRTIEDCIGMLFPSSDREEITG